MKTSELIGAELDYWVAKAEGWSFFWSKHNYWSVAGPQGETITCDDGWTEYDPYTGQKNKQPAPHTCIHYCDYSPSTNWNQCGELIEKYDLLINPKWVCRIQFDIMNEIPLKIAICRCVVASVYGEELSDE